MENTHFRAEFGQAYSRRRKDHETRISKMDRMETKEKANTVLS
jgi:hypothetical protein